MVKINYKIQFALFIICLFFIGLGIFEILTEGLKTGTALFWQISAFVPFVTSAIIFGYNLYFKRIGRFKNHNKKMNATAEQYISGLKNAYLEYNADQEWNHFEKIKHGAAKKDLEKLEKTYPDIPDALISLLKYVDGTYWREYAGEKIAFYFLGSDVEEYPYYLLSSQQILENKNQASEYYSDYIAREYDEVEVDEKITDKPEILKWVHFSDCMNNGGTSQLFIDFSPSEKGKIGQVVRYLHDPDEIIVIADSFEEYLKKLMDKEYDFINEDVVE